MDTVREVHHLVHNVSHTDVVLAVRRSLPADGAHTLQAPTLGLAKPTYFSFIDITSSMVEHMVTGAAGELSVIVQVDENTGPATSVIPIGISFARPLVVPTASLIFRHDFGPETGWGGCAKGGEEGSEGGSAAAAGTSDGSEEDGGAVPPGHTAVCGFYVPLVATLLYRWRSNIYAKIKKSSRSAALTTLAAPAAPQLGRTDSLGSEGAFAAVVSSQTQAQQRGSAASASAAGSHPRLTLYLISGSTVSMDEHHPDIPQEPSTTEHAAILIGKFASIATAHSGEGGSASGAASTAAASLSGLPVVQLTSCGDLMVVKVPESSSNAPATTAPVSSSSSLASGAVMTWDRVAAATGMPALPVSVHHIPSGTEVLRYDANVSFLKHSLVPHIDAQRRALVPAWTEKWLRHYSLTISMAAGSPARLAAVAAVLRQYQPGYLHLPAVKAFWYTGDVPAMLTTCHAIDFDSIEGTPAVDVRDLDEDAQLIVAEMRRHMSNVLRVVRGTPDFRIYHNPPPAAALPVAAPHHHHHHDALGAEEGLSQSGGSRRPSQSRPALSAAAASPFSGLVGAAAAGDSAYVSEADSVSSAGGGARSGSSSRAGLSSATAGQKRPRAAFDAEAAAAVPAVSLHRGSQAQQQQRGGPAVSRSVSASPARAGSASAAGHATHGAGACSCCEAGSAGSSSAGPGLPPTAHQDHELASFWLRKTRSPVLAVLYIRKGPFAPRQFYFGMNVEVSMPTGSVCSERVAISMALAADPGLKRSDIKAVAVLSLPRLDHPDPRVQASYEAAGVAASSTFYRPALAAPGGASAAGGGSSGEASFVAYGGLPHAAAGGGGSALAVPPLLHPSTGPLSSAGSVGSLSSSSAGGGGGLTATTAAAFGFVPGVRRGPSASRSGSPRAAASASSSSSYRASTPAALLLDVADVGPQFASKGGPAPAFTAHYAQLGGGRSASASAPRAVPGSASRPRTGSVSSTTSGASMTAGDAGGAASEHSRQPKRARLEEGGYASVGSTSEALASALPPPPPSTASATSGGSTASSAVPGSPSTREYKFVSVTRSASDGSGVVVEIPVALNPIAPCGSCMEWLRKVAEVNPDFRVLTFTDISCEKVFVKHVPPS